MNIPQLIFFACFCLVSCQVKSQDGGKNSSSQSAKKSAEAGKRTVVAKKSKVSQVGQVALGKSGKTQTVSKAKSGSKAKGGSKGHGRASKKIKWRSNIKWQAWAEGREAAAKQGKALCLVVYTDWCPRCRELAPLFQDPGLEALSKDLIMVKQDQDERPAWLSQYANSGRYVPRILFFGRDGQLKADINSGIRKYPYFYTPRSLAALKSSMKKAIGQ